MERLNLKNISIKTFTPEDEKKWEEDQKMLKIKEIELRKLDYKMSMGFLKNEKIPSFKEFNPKLQNKNSNSYKEILDLLETVKRWSESDKGWLTLIGGVGVGKTHLLKSAIFRANGYYLTAYEFDQRIKDFRSGMEDKNTLIFTDPDEWRSRIANMKRHLVIDDIGAGYIQRGWTLSRFERLIDLRYRNQLPTAIATNLDEKTLDLELGERINSRIRDRNYAIVKIISYGQDIRRINRNDKY